MTAIEYLEKHGLPNMPTQLIPEEQTNVKDTASAFDELVKQNSKLKKALTESNDILSWMLDNADVPNSLESHFYNGTTNVIEQNKALIEA